MAQETRAADDTDEMVNSGSVFPLPDGRGAPQRHTFGSPTSVAAGQAFSPKRPALSDFWRYLGRTIAVLIVLTIMVVGLIWAWGELGKGWSALIDLFQSADPASGPGFDVGG